jgi:hypothetical protein
MCRSLSNKDRLQLLRGMMFAKVKQHHQSSCHCVDEDAFAAVFCMLHLQRGNFASIYTNETSAST